MGASETGKVPSDRFSYLRQSFTFAYRKLDPVLLAKTESKKTAATLERIETQPLVSKASIPTTKVEPKSSAIANPYPSTATTRAIAVTAMSPLSDLQLARELADAGHLAAAIDGCNAYLECHSTNAEAYTLLGTLYQAMKHYQQAERCFQKALYLQPHHYEALMQLALLKEACGDVIGAERLQQRIQNSQHTS